MNKKKIIEMEVIMDEIADTKENVKETIRYWQSVLDELDRRAMEYSELFSAMRAKEDEDKKRRDTVESMMKLNLRGQVFDTTKYILLNGDSTYLSALLASTTWELDGNGEYFIDRCGNGFDRVLKYMCTGELSTEGLNRYDKDCVYDNLKCFGIPYKSRWDYSRVSLVENLKLDVYLQLLDGRICGITDDFGGICIYNMDTNVIESDMEGHKRSIRGIIQLEDGRLCSCAEDKSIKLWNIESGVCELTMIGHTDYVYFVIQLIDGRLCSGSEDKSMKLWCKDNGACELTISNDSIPFRIAQLRDGRICSGDSCGSVKIRNTTTGVCDMTLNGHTDVIRSILVIDELRICSCSSDKTMKLWNVSTGTCERTLEGHTDEINSAVLLFDGRLCSVSDDRSIKIWTVETGVCDLTVYAGCTGLYKVTLLDDGRLVVSNTSRRVYIIGV
jgi:WD40 repeat protein